VLVSVVERKGGVEEENEHNGLGDEEVAFLQESALRISYFLLRLRLAPETLTVNIRQNDESRERQNHHAVQVARDDLRRRRAKRDALSGLI